MLKVAMVGCGKIADSHVSQIQRIPRCQLVATCDRELLMARQLGQRFRINRHFTDVRELLDSVRPDVVHITTPPQSHASIATQCLEHGSHVYVEKPFTVNADEARALISLASAKGLKITAGHDDQFTHAARRMRRLVASGYLGGPPVHMESTYCYDLADVRYAKAFLSDSQHWLRRLPGKLLHNIISHGIARIAEFLTTDEPDVLAHGFVSPRLRELGECDIVDELRVIVSEEQRLTAYFTFSSQMRPSVHQLRLYGTKNGIFVDQDHETVIKLRGGRYSSYAQMFVPPMTFAGQHLGNLATNVRTFLRRDFHFKSGMKFLIESFYSSIREGTPLPITYREILLTATIMDRIFEQTTTGRPRNAKQPCIA